MTNPDNEKLEQMRKTQKYLLLGGLAAIGSSVMKSAGLFQAGFLPGWFGYLAGGVCLVMFVSVTVQLSGKE